MTREELIATWNGLTKLKDEFSDGSAIIEARRLCEVVMREEYGDDFWEEATR